MKRGGGKSIFVLGGARSGKSRFALELAGKLKGVSPDDSRAYVATATARDKEMAERIKEHKKARAGGGGGGGEKIKWVTIEEPIRVRDFVRENNEFAVVLIDCITLWLSNLVEEGMSDSEIMEEAEGLARLSRDTWATVVAVSGELGQGIVPRNKLARRFRDLSGLVNQAMAEAADEVFFISAGLPVKMK
ncbi:MAG: bifunctional adenosylcobinamide kinase/adenosylcobinamide-phosphate guanylyltransferase [Thermodesulfobacteriota bacterium]